MIYTTYQSAFVGVSAYKQVMTCSSFGPQEKPSASDKQVISNYYSFIDIVKFFV